MRKKLLAFSLALAMMIGMAVPAGAYKLVDWGHGPVVVPDNETNEWWQQHREDLQSRNIYNGYMYGTEYCGDLNDGLYQVYVPDNNGGLTDDYVDKDGNLVNLNRGRYNMMFAFSEGKAAAFSGNPDGNLFTRISYIDTNGNEIISPKNEWMSFNDFSDYFVGYFKGGKAVVIREDLNQKKGGCIDSDYFRGLYYAYIDTNGDYISEWAYAGTMEEVCKLPLYNQVGVWIGHSYLADLSKVDINAWNNSQGQQTVPEVPQTPARQWHGPALPDYNQNAPSLFASTAKVTGFYLGDLDFGEVKITITNPSGVTDAGVIAAVFVNADLSSNNRAGCFFVPYELSAGESREYSVEMTHIFNQNMFDVKSGIKYAQQLEGAVDAAIITFEGHEDMVSFYNTIPYEQNWQPVGLVSEFQHICDAEAGNAWLRMIGLPRISPYLIATGYPQTDGSYIPGSDADHSFCAR